MLDLSHFAILFVLFLGLQYIRLVRGISYNGGVPRMGKPGVLGYIQTAIKWTIDSKTIIVEGRKQFSGKAFVIPSLSGPVFFLPPEYLERVRGGPDSKFSQVLAVNQSLQLPYTMDKYQLDNPVQARVMRTDVSRALPVYIPQLLDESVLSIREALETSGPSGIPVFDTMTHMVARISNRVIFGKELCRDEKFIHDVVRFAETVAILAVILSWCPYVLRGALYFVLSSIVGGKKAPLKIIVPHLKQCAKDREGTADEPTLVSEFMLRAAPPEESIERIAVRMLNIEFGSIHTSSIFITQALFEVALLSSKDVESMRSEIKDALETEGGWNKASLEKFYKVDSALREVGRCYGLMHFALPRVAVVPCDLEDGTYVPAGSTFAVDMTAIHFDPEIYPDPHRCDLFRFSKLRAKDSADAKYAFSTVDANYLPFGAGRHACAGRNFASTELKIMLAHILLEYDVALPPGIEERPKNIIFNGGVVPDTKAHLVFKRRTDAKA